MAKWQNLSDAQLKKQWPQINKRRCYLIIERMHNDITAEESAELERLQALADRRLSLLPPEILHPRPAHAEKETR